VIDRQTASQEVATAIAPLMQTIGTMQPFVVGGRVWDAMSLVNILVTDPAQLDAHIALCPAWVAFFGVVVADAKREHDMKQSDYRQARDTWHTQRRAEGKVTQAALEDEWRIQSNYKGWQEALTTSERAWSCASFVHDALQRKSQMLTNLTKLYSDERAASATTRNVSAYGPALTR